MVNNYHYVQYEAISCQMKQVYGSRVIEFPICKWSVFDVHPGSLQYYGCNKHTVLLQHLANNSLKVSPIQLTLYALNPATINK